MVLKVILNIRKCTTQMTERNVLMYTCLVNLVEGRQRFRRELMVASTLIGSGMITNMDLDISSSLSFGQDWTRSTAWQDRKQTPFTLSMRCLELRTRMLCNGWISEILQESRYVSLIIIFIIVVVTRRHWF